MVNLDTNVYYYYAIAVSFIFGAFIEEWISGRLLVKESKGTKFLSAANPYLSKERAILVRIIEVLTIPLISIPISLVLLWLIEQSGYYILAVSLMIFNTIYLGTLLELPYKIKPGEVILIVLIYAACVTSIFIIRFF